MGRLSDAGCWLALAAVAAGGAACATPRSLAQAYVRLPQGIDKECFETSLESEPHILDLREDTDGGKVGFSFELADPRLIMSHPDLGGRLVPSFSVSQRLVSGGWILVIIGSYTATEETGVFWREGAIQRQQAILSTLVGRCLGGTLEFERPEECSKDAQYFVTEGKTQTICVTGRLIETPRT